MVKQVVDEEAKNDGAKCQHFQLKSSQHQFYKMSEQWGLRIQLCISATKELKESSDTDTSSLRQSPQPKMWKGWRKTDMLCIYNHVTAIIRSGL